MNPPNSRKQLLIAESELNRAELVQEWQTMADGACALVNRARTVGSFAFAAASLVAGLASFRRKKFSADRNEKPSWWRAVSRSAGLFSTFWRAFHPSGRGQKGK